MKTRLSSAECYKLLNVLPGTKKAEIKKVFGEFAKKNHPDKNTDKTPDEIKKLNEEFIKVKEAYEFLDQYDDSVLCAQAPSDEKQSGDASSIQVPLQWIKKPDAYLKGIPVALANFVIVEGKCPFQEKYKDIWGVVDMNKSKPNALEAMMDCINENAQGIKNANDVYRVIENFYYGSPWAARLEILEPLWDNALKQRQNLKSPSSSNEDVNLKLLESTSLRP